MRVAILFRSKGILIVNAYCATMVIGVQFEDACIHIDC
jgi:hypothetical protein